jgi:hypothetical protein
MAAFSKEDRAAQILEMKSGQSLTMGMRRRIINTAMPMPRDAPNTSEKQGTLLARYPTQHLMFRGVFT